MASVVDIEQDYGINAKRSVLLQGINSTDIDEDIVDALSTYGNVVKIVRPSLTQAILEFDSEEALKHISFPSLIDSPVDPSTKWCLDNIEILVTASTHLHLAKDSDPSSSRQDEDSQDSGEVDSDSSGATVVSIPLTKQTLPPNPTQSDPQLLTGTVKAKKKSKHVPDMTPKERPETSSATLSADILNNQEVQRVIVEYVIKNEASTGLCSKRLRSFSGRVPKPPGEVDFETWCLHVELMFQDGYSTDMQRRLILESLLSPAADTVKQLGSHSPPQEYVKLLQSAYGLVDDGEEIFAKFLSTHQDAGEKASEYIQRLHTLLNTAVKRGGVSKSNANRQLYKQFVRGCWDQTLLLTLQQKLKSEPAPEFSELLLELRTEEERRSIKVDRMQRHFGSSKAKPLMQFQGIQEPVSITNTDSDMMQRFLTETESLRKQVAELQMQLTEKRAQRRKKRDQKSTVPKDSPVAAVAEMQVHQPVPKSSPKAWFCFKCGENSHIARECTNAPNKELVDKKYKELKTRQQEWQAKYGQALNWTGFQ